MTAIFDIKSTILMFKEAVLCFRVVLIYQCICVVDHCCCYNAATVLGPDNQTTISLTKSLVEDSKDSLRLTVLTKLIEVILFAENSKELLQKLHMFFQQKLAVFIYLKIFYLIN